MAVASTVVFDKTGTLTKGELTVVKSRIMDENIHKIQLLYSLLNASSHPVSLSIKKYLESKYENLQIKNLENVKNIEAKGMSAIYKNIENKEFEILGGNIELLREFGIFYKFDSHTEIVFSRL